MIVRYTQVLSACLLVITHIAGHDAEKRIQKHVDTIDQNIKSMHTNVQKLRRIYDTLFTYASAPQDSSKHAIKKLQEIDVCEKKVDKIRNQIDRNETAITKHKRALYRQHVWPIINTYSPHVWAQIAPSMHPDAHHDPYSCASLKTTIHELSRASQLASQHGDTYKEDTIATLCSYVNAQTERLLRSINTGSKQTSKVIPQATPTQPTPAMHEWPYCGWFEVATTIRNIIESNRPDHAKANQRFVRLLLDYHAIYKQLENMCKLSHDSSNTMLQGYIRNIDQLVNDYKAYVSQNYDAMTYTNNKHDRLIQEPYTHTWGKYRYYIPAYHHLDTLPVSSTLYTTVTTMKETIASFIQYINDARVISCLYTYNMPQSHINLLRKACQLADRHENISNELANLLKRNAVQSTYMRN